MGAVVEDLGCELKKVAYVSEHGTFEWYWVWVAWDLARSGVCSSVSVRVIGAMHLSFEWWHATASMFRDRLMLVDIVADLDMDSCSCQLG
jgi:hypothetical protein